MKRTVFPVLLVVLTLLCASSLFVSAAAAGDKDDAFLKPGVTKPHDDQIVDVLGTPGDDDSEGDPDTMGGGFGMNKSNDLLSGLSGCEGDQDPSWVEFMLYLLDIFPIVR